VAAAVLAWSLAACSHPAPAKTSTEALPPAAEATTRSPGAPSPAATPSPPPLPAYCHQGGPELWAHLATCHWPGPTNTGPDLSQCPGGQLTDDSGSITRTIAVTKPNAVISCESIQGMLDIEAPNVTIENTVIVANSGRTGEDANGTAAITVEAGASAVVDHVKINGDDGVHACIWHQGTSLAVNAVNCFGADDGIFSWADSGSPGSGDHFVIKNSYFHGFTHATSNGHEDGYQTEGASFGLIKHNTYRMAADADSAIAIWDSLKSSSDIRIRHNLITGGGFSIYAEDYDPGDGGPGNPSAVGGFSDTGISFVSNVFSTHASGCVGQFGVWFERPWAPYDGGPTDGWRRSGNRVLETGENVDNGNPSGAGLFCG
jgi:hypothetical protein